MLQDHSWGLLAAQISSAVIFLFGLIINFLSMPLYFSPEPTVPDLLGKENYNMTWLNVLPISHGRWLMAMWVVVYLCQVFWLSYGLAGICRQTSSGPAYNNPKLMPVPLHFFFSLAVLLQVSWLILWEQNYISLSLLLISLAASSAVASLVVGYNSLSLGHSRLVQEGRQVDIWIIRILCHNPLALLLIWLMLHSLYNLAFVMSLVSTTQRVLDFISFIYLIILSIIILGYTIFDLVVLEKFSRYVMLPYIAFILFVAGPLFKDWSSVLDPLFIFLLALQSLTFVLLLLKAIVLSWRMVTKNEDETETMRILSPVDEAKYLLP